MKLPKNIRPKLATPAIKKATENTKFHIDYGWWEKSNLDLKTYLYTRLNVGEHIQTDVEMSEVDLVDVETGEVTRVDGFQYIVQTYFNQLPPDFAKRASLVDAVFCVLLANANRPMTIRELSNRVQRPSSTLLTTFGGSRVYQGIRPIYGDE